MNECVCVCVYVCIYIYIYIYIDSIDTLKQNYQSSMIYNYILFIYNMIPAHEVIVYADA